MTQPTRHRVGGMLVDSCAHTHRHGPHTQDGGTLHCPGHPAPPPEQLGTDTVLAARQFRREQLAVLLSRAARGVLTTNEGPLLRANVETELADANTAYLELDNQRETFDIAWEQQAADLERARRWAVQLENDNRRLEDRARKAERAANLLAGSHRRAERAEQLLTEYVRLADITHTYGAMGGHDRLGADLTCAGCQLRDRARTALDNGEQPECAGCGDTGACAGGPCAHPNATKEPTR